MLPRSRLLAVALVGLGAVLVSVGLVLPLWLPTDGRMPTAIPGWTVRLVDGQARVGEDTTALVRQRHVTFTPHGDSATVMARVGQATLKEGTGPDLDRLVSAEVLSFRMNRVSGQTVGDASISRDIGSPPQRAGMGGVWLKFPAFPQKQDYAVFDDVTGEAFLATYAGTDKVLGRTVATYIQRIPDTVVVDPEPAPPTSGLGPRPAVEVTPAGDEKEKVRALGQPERHYTATRTYTVDTASGIIIDEKVRSHEWVELDGARSTVIALDAEYPREDVQAMVDIAKEFPNVRFRAVARILLIVSGALLLIPGAVISVVGVRRLRRRGGDTPHMH